MGLSFSRSVTFGAMYSNFAVSCIGMSVGVRVFISIGPRGAYISDDMGSFHDIVGGDVTCRFSRAGLYLSSEVFFP